jgi:hypothetical protein
VDVFGDIASALTLLGAAWRGDCGFGLAEGRLGLPTAAAVSIVVGS